MWNILFDVRAPWLVEFAAALTRIVPARCYSPRTSTFSGFMGKVQRKSLADPGLEFIELNTPRGSFSSAFGRTIVCNRLLKLLLDNCTEPKSSPLVCCLPHYARLAKQWPGPVIYYVTDKFADYEGLGFRGATVRALEAAICRHSTLVCPNSRRIADHLTEHAGCVEGQIVILPNAVRESNILPTPPASPVPLPRGIGPLQRPVAGVIGNLASNMDWVLLEEVVQQTPWLSWAFVGPFTMNIADPSHRSARQRLCEHGGRVVFCGPKPYSSLRDYALAFDVAILPYLRREPTFSGSSTRFYEHLAACRPMLATRGFEELLHKEPLLRLVDSAASMTAALEELRGQHFQDGREALRWRTSLKETWSERARLMLHALAAAFAAAQ